MLTEIQEKTTILRLQRMCEKNPPKQIVFTTENNPESSGFIRFNLTFDSIICKTCPDVIALYNSNSSGKMCVSFHSIEEIYIESFRDWKTVKILCTVNLSSTTGISSNKKEYTVIFKY